jgi:hypothetical protein
MGAIIKKLYVAVSNKAMATKAITVFALRVMYRVGIWVWVIPNKIRWREGWLIKVTIEAPSLFTRNMNLVGLSATGAPE